MKPGELTFVAFCSFAIALSSGCLSEQDRQTRAAAEEGMRNEQERRSAEAQQAAKEALRATSKQRLEAYWNDLTEHNYNYARTRYLQSTYAGDVYAVNRFGDEKRRDNKIRIEPRFPIGKNDVARGRGMIEAFGLKYMPNAYSAFEKKRDSAEEVLQMFGEEFPDPWRLKPDAPEWNAYCKLLKALCKARTNYLRIHDEICHFYVLHKIGALSESELAKIDCEGAWEVWLLAVNGDDVAFPVQEVKAIDSKTADFAAKHMPETYAQYLALTRTRNEVSRLYEEVLSDMRLMDVVRFELGAIACCEKMNYIAQALEEMASDMKSLHADYKIMDKDSEAVAQVDHKMGLHWKSFASVMSTFVKDRSNGMLIPVANKVNEFFPNCYVLKWHCYALGFPVSGRGKATKHRSFEQPVSGFEKVTCPRYDYEWEQGLVYTGDAFDTVSAVSAISSDYKDLFAFIEQGRDPRRYHWVFKQVSDIKCWPRDEHDDRCLWYCAFAKVFGVSDYWGWESPGKPLAALKNASATQGVVAVSLPLLLTKFVKMPWNAWTGCGEQTPIPTPFERRLADVSGGRLDVEIQPCPEKNDRDLVAWCAIVK